MTYSYVHRMINSEAFPHAPELYSKEYMVGRGRGKYWYRQSIRDEGELFLKAQIEKRFPDNKIVYFCWFLTPVSETYTIIYHSITIKIIINTARWTDFRRKSYDNVQGNIIYIFLHIVFSKTPSCCDSVFELFSGHSIY